MPRREYRVMERIGADEWRQVGRMYQTEDAARWAAIDYWSEDVIELRVEACDAPA